MKPHRHEGDDIELKAEEIDGRKIKIYVTPEGEFYAKSPADEGSNVEAPTRAALVLKLRGIVRRKAVRVAIPAMKWSAGGWRGEKPSLEAVTLTGVHGSNGNLLVKDKAGHTEQNRGYSDDDILRAMTTAEQKEFLEMHRTMKHAAAAFETLLNSYKVNGKELVRAAMKEAGVAGEDLGDE